MVYDKAQNSKWFAPPPPDPWPPVSRRPPVVASCGSFQGVCAHTHRHLQAALVVENPPANAGDARDAGPVPGWGRSGGGHGNPLQDSCLENPTDRRAWRATVHGVTMSSHTHTHTRTHTRTHTAAVHCSTSACLFHLTDPLENAPYFFLIKTRPTALPSGRR